MTSNEGETNNVDANNRVISTIEADLTTSTYTYDDDGNLIKKTYADQTSEDYQYDVWGRMTSYTNRDGVTTVYTYYADGLRKSKQTAGGDVTHYYYDGDVVINETEDGELSASNTVVGSRIVQREEAGSTEAALIYNTHGDVALVLNVNGGDPVRTYLYEAYGKVYSGYDATYNSPILYAGQYYDYESAMYYLRARYYSPDLKRFTQEDTHWNPSNMIYGDREYKPDEKRVPDYSAILQSSNLYGYCINNPVRHYDPTGKIAISIGVGAGLTALWELAQVIGVSVLALLAMIATDYAIDSVDKAISNATSNTKRDESNGTIIYRLGSGNATNLTPREVDVTGLSYTTVKPTSGSYTMTTIEAVNATGCLVAIQDGNSHVSVRPVNQNEMEDWIDSRPNATTNPHEYTTVLQGISIRVR